MRIKKMISIIMIFIVTIAISNKAMAVEYREIDYTDRSEIITEAFSEWIDTFKSEDTPENKRILDYQIGGMGISESNKNKIRATVEFKVTPFSKDNTEWNYTEVSEKRTINGQEFVISQNDNICFLEMTNVDGEYQVDYIAETPKGYDEFERRFEEYKQTHLQEKAESIQIQGQETNNNLANREIEKMSYIIVVGCSIILFVVVGFIMIKFVKYKRNQ